MLSRQKQFVWISPFIGEALAISGLVHDLLKYQCGSFEDSV